MTEYLNKQAVLEWIDDRRYKSPWIESFRERLESGAFDATKNFTDEDIKTALTRELTDERVAIAAAYWLDASPHESWVPDGIILARYARAAMDEIQRLRAALELIKRYEIMHNMRKTTVWKIADEALSTTTEPTGPYTIRRYEGAGYNRKGQPFAAAIERNGYTVLQLEVGTERNEGEVEHIVDLLNNRSPEQHLMWEIKGLLESWDFRAIAAELESGYDQGVLVELVELCEKLTGAKSPRVNAPEGDGNA